MTPFSGYSGTPKVEKVAKTKKRKHFGKLQEKVSGSTVKKETSHVVSGFKLKRIKKKTHNPVNRKIGKKRIKRRKV